ncbi:phage tail assembly chaperone [Paenibacillus sp. 2RAB27]|uniref:phage tail assembly chaperone n=1 Tax=Paenibacillus sp. 2RAB27 TaxID=3232991 RepID=UPI003F954AD4
MADKHKDVTILGREFRVKKFDARTGSFMLIKIAGLIAPLLGKIDFKKINAEATDPSQIDTGSFDIMGIIGELGKLSEADFAYVQEKCLRVCYELLPAGPAPVLDDRGNFGVIGLEDDTMSVMALTGHAIMVNLQGFFTGSPLGSILGGILNTSQRTSQM